MRPDLEYENNYYKAILKHPVHGEIGRKYLESRGIEQRTIDKWEIGFSPYGCTPPCFDKDDPFKPYEKLWGRITFPIRDQNGKLVSISGRLVLQIKGKPKYDHYSFPSRKILFGINLNKENIRKKNKCIITEGQMDVISSWQRGLDIVTSSFGAHCSLDHFAILSRYTDNIYILYDEDGAGKRGTQAVIDFPTWGDLNVNLLNGFFPAGEDLDSWIQKNNVEKLMEKLNRNHLNDLKNKLNSIKKI